MEKEKSSMCYKDMKFYERREWIERDYDLFVHIEQLREKDAQLSERR